MIKSINFNGKKIFARPREQNSVGRYMFYYMQGSGFEPRTPHLFTLNNVNSTH